MCFEAYHEATLLCHQCLPVLGRTCMLGAENIPFLSVGQAEPTDCVPKCSTRGDQRERRWCILFSMQAVAWCRRGVDAIGIFRSIGSNFMLLRSQNSPRALPMARYDAAPVRGASICRLMLLLLVLATSSRALVVLQSGAFFVIGLFYLF